MPLYDYQCEAGHRYEKRESFGAPAQQPCERCGKPARRLLNAPPIVFKGSGWYKTDHGRSVRATETADTSVPSSEDGGGGSDAPEAAPKPKRAKKAESTGSAAASASADD